MELESEIFYVSIRNIHMMLLHHWLNVGKTAASVLKVGFVIHIALQSQLKLCSYSML